MTNSLPEQIGDLPIAEPVRKADAKSIPEAGLLGRWVNGGGFVFAIAICASAIILLIEIFLRYVLDSPTIWAHETTTFLCGISFLYGGLYCASRNSHIRVALIYDHLPKGIRHGMDIFISVTSFVAASFFTYAAFIMAKKALFAPTGAFRLERSGSAWNPPTPAVLKVFLCVVLVLMAVQFLILTYNYARNAGRRAE